jgi:toxin ParE1/3/4
MAYRVNLTARAAQDLDNIYQYIQAEESAKAAAWFNGLQETVMSLSSLPFRAAVTPEDPTLRHLLYGNKPHIYRVIYSVDEKKHTVTVLTVRHGARSPLE